MESGGGASSSVYPLLPARTPKPARRRHSSVATGSSRSSQSGKPQPPPPEVISSLISSLAGITIPDQHHRHEIPGPGSNETASPSLNPSYGASSQSTNIVRLTNGRDPSRTPPPQQGFGVDYGAYRQSEEVEQESYLVANTAFPPVVRLSKKRETSSTSGSRTPTLRPSQQSLRSRDEPASFGQPTIEPGIQPRSPSVSTLNLAAISRIVGRKPSKDAISIGKNGRENATSRNLPDSWSPMINGLRDSGSDSSLMRHRIDEAGAGWQPSAAVPPISSSNVPSSFTPAAPSNPRAPDHPGAVPTGRVIPSRQSSLQHDAVHGAGKRLSKSSKLSRRSHQNRHRRTGQEVMEDGQEVLVEEDSTVRRIQELKEQKEQREGDQNREERRPKKKQARNSMPALATPRTISNQSLRHSVAEIVSRFSDQHSVGDDGAPAPAVPTYHKTRKSPGQVLSKASQSSQARTESVRHEDRPAMGSRPVTPPIHQRALSDPQFSPGRGSIGGDRPRSADSIDDVVDAYLASPRLTQRIPHPQTGRIIAFSEVGDRSGFPVICCVGMGMTRYIMAFYDELALTLRLRLITIDRPGVGESEACSDGTGIPLNWPDDITIVCNALSVSKFSLIAHSAGAIYALATALRLPQQVRGRLHLMAPWIPPSQMEPIGAQQDAVPSTSVPYSQKLLRVLPASFLRAANSSFMSSTSSSGMLKSPRRSKRKSAVLGNGVVDVRPSSSSGISNHRYSTQQPAPSATASTTDLPITAFPSQSPSYVKRHAALRESDGLPDESIIRAYQLAYDANLTQRIWDLAQRHANPAIDLLICLERRQSIGFHYVDITRACVFHHGSRDSRVPLENVKWLAKKMKRCEVRVLEGEGHSLMASAKIMAEILTEVAREWEDWSRVTRDGKARRVFSDALDS